MDVQQVVKHPCDDYLGRRRREGRDGGAALLGKGCLAKININ